MAHENDYPNRWKDGWSSADHATESYSPYAWERARRDASFSQNKQEEKTYSQRWVEQQNEEIAQARREQAVRRGQEYWKERDREREQQEQERAMQREEQREEKRRACNAANYRYKRLSMLEKAKVILSRKNPKRLNMESMDIDEINQLYRGKTR